MSENTQMGDTTREQLRRYVERIERLDAEKTELSADIREVYAEAKTFGFDTKILRKAIALRKLDEHERAEVEILLELYMEVIDNDN